MSPPSSCSISALRGGLGDQERALGHHVVLQVPVRVGGLEQRLRQRQAGVVDDQVDAAEGEHGRVDRGLHRGLVGDVDLRRRSATSGAADLGRGGLRLLQVEVGDRRRTRPRRRAGSAMALPMPDAAPVTSAMRRGERLGLRHPLQLGLLERPVLDAELLRLVDRGVGRERLGAAHHVDRVDVELAGDAGGLLVLAEGEHARRPGTSTISGSAPRIAGRVRRRVAVVVAPGSRRGTPRAAPAAGRSTPRRTRSAGRSSTSGLTLVRRKWSGQLVPSAASRGCSAEARKSSTTSASVKWPTIGLSCEARPRIVGARAAALARRSASGSGGVPVQRRAERLGLAVLGDVRLGGVDDPQRVRLGLLAGVAPRGDAVAAEDAADRLRVRRLDRGDVQARAGSRGGATAPRRPCRRRSPWSAPRRRRRSRSRCRSRGAGGRRARRRPGRASRCRSTAPRRPCRAGSSRTRRPSRPRGRRPGRRRRARASGPGAARPGPPRSACRGRRRSP